MSRTTIATSIITMTDDENHGAKITTTKALTESFKKEKEEARFTVGCQRRVQKATSYEQDGWPQPTAFEVVDAKLHRVAEGDRR